MQPSKGRLHFYTLTEPDYPIFMRRNSRDNAKITKSWYWH